MDPGTPADWRKPSHAEIRMAILQLGDHGFEEIREALTGGCEPFASQMDRRMKTRRPELRPAYKVLRNAGSDKVRTHLASVDHQGLHKPRSRRRKTGRRRPVPIAR